MTAKRQRVTILGATGTIGVNTLRVIADHPDRFEVFALTANCNVALLAEQCRRFRPRLAVLGTPQAAAELERDLASDGLDTAVLHGEEGLVAAARDVAVDTVMAAIVGGAGLLPTLAAARAGKKVLLANKESLVMSGELFMQAAADSGACILPIDSEHNAIFQCLPASGSAALREPDSGFRKIVLTASGGPFHAQCGLELSTVTPDQACKHPNWLMGRKISVDSATLVNKGLELIEASYLFATPAERIEVLVHPQSIVHSLVYYTDGSVLAQLGNPDMRTPIAYGLAWPARIDAGVQELDLASIGRLDFQPPDLKRFPGLALGRQVAEARGAAPVLFNAANEEAVAAFLAGQAGFMEIPAIIDRVLQDMECPPPASLEEVLDIDRQARKLARQLLRGA